ncbi:tail protein X [Paenibacillus pedocola]|uniref:tail protein X n=1 Tax=Paenibacillus pedocola TaxID=3242193 RepID=UPI0028772FA5|nr:tail protein X [Paenibacillus typhae]
MIYKSVQGDTWDSIAFKLYGDEYLMTLLINANPELAQTVVFSGNVPVNVPDKPVDASDTLPPWRREG